MISTCHHCHGEIESAPNGLGKSASCPHCEEETPLTMPEEPKRRRFRLWRSWRRSALPEFGKSIALILAIVGLFPLVAHPAAHLELLHIGGEPWVSDKGTMTWWTAGYPRNNRITHYTLQVSSDLEMWERYGNYSVRASELGEAGWGFDPSGEPRFFRLKAHYDLAEGLQ